MNSFSTRNASLLAAIATLIAGCGGGDSATVAGTPAPVVSVAPASVAAVADAKSVAWNAASSIDVLANDTVSRGVLAITAVTGAEHGTATIADNKILYTPAAGYIGTEKLSYTVVGEGGGSGKADAVITVEAVVTLNGNASDNPISGGTVTATVGTRTFTAPTNANGDFSLTLRSNSSTDFITLVANGVGAQAPVKLASLVGDVAGLAKSVTSGNQVSMAAVPAIGVTHISSAFMALATRSNGGVVPSSAQQIKDATAKVDIDDVMRLATAIKLTADKGVPLPAGVSDTLAMVNSEAGVSAVYTAAAAISPTLASATRSGVEGEVSAPAAAFTLDGLAERTIVYRDFTVTYRKDNTGHMSGRLGEHDLTWSSDGATVRLVYAKKSVLDYPAGAGVKVNGVAAAYDIRENTDGMVILRVLNDATVKYGETGSVTWTTGPDAGKAVVGASLTTTNAPTTLSTAFNLDQRLPIPASLTAVGTSLAGVFANPRPTFDTQSNPGTAYVNGVPQSTDMLNFVSATEARFVLSGARVNWSIKDNYLVITDMTAGSVTWKMALVGSNTSNGQLQWVAVEDNVTVPFITVQGDMPTLPVFTDALAVHKFAEVKTKQFSGQPLADHTVASINYSSATYNSTWVVNAAGELVITNTRKSNNQPLALQRYIPVSWAGNKLTVLYTNGGFSQVIVLEDLSAQK